MDNLIHKLADETGKSLPFIFTPENNSRRRPHLELRQKKKLASKKILFTAYFSDDGDDDEDTDCVIMTPRGNFFGTPDDFEIPADSETSDGQNDSSIDSSERKYDFLFGDQDSRCMSPEIMSDVREEQDFVGCFDDRRVMDISDDEETPILSEECHTSQDSDEPRNSEEQEDFQEEQEDSKEPRNSEEQEDSQDSEEQEYRVSGCTGMYQYQRQHFSDEDMFTFLNIMKIHPMPTSRDEWIHISNLFNTSIHVAKKMRKSRTWYFLLDRFVKECREISNTKNFNYRTRKRSLMKQILIQMFYYLKHGTHFATRDDESARKLEHIETMYLRGRIELTNGVIKHFESRDYYEEMSSLISSPVEVPRKETRGRKRKNPDIPMDQYSCTFFALRNDRNKLSRKVTKMEKTLESEKIRLEKMNAELASMASFEK